METRLVVCALIQDETGKFLVGRKSPGNVYANQIGIPGGKVEENEDEIKALFREIKEETSLEIRSPTKIDFIQEGTSSRTSLQGKEQIVRMTFTYYLCLTPDPSRLTPNQEWSQLEFMSQDELKRIKKNLNEPTKTLFKHLKLI